MKKEEKTISKKKIFIIVCCCLVFVFSLLYNIFPSLALSLNNLFKVLPSDKEGLYVHFIDVGSGDSIYINENESNILIDTGNSSLRSKSLEYLKDNNVTNLDLMILTHADIDHIGSAFDIISEIDVKKVVLPTNSLNSIEDNEEMKEIVDISIEKEIEVEEISAYSEINVGDLTFEIISPMIVYENDNDNSIVSILRYGEYSFMFTGDATKSENDIIATYGDLDIDILKVSHHGSRYSTSDEFLKTTTPEFSIISVGPNNYGLPTYDLIDRIEQTGSQVLRTDLHGNIVFFTDGEDLEYNTQRKE